MATILDFGKATDEVLRVHGISATVRVNEGGGAVGVLVCNSDGVMPAKGSDLKDATILVLLQDYDEAGVAAFRSIGLVNSGDGKRHCWEVPREGVRPCEPTRSCWWPAPRGWHSSSKAVTVKWTTSCSSSR